MQKKYIRLKTALKKKVTSKNSNRRLDGCKLGRFLPKKKECTLKDYMFPIE